MLALAEEHDWTLGRVALAYEAELLGLPEQAVIAEVTRRFGVMQAAVRLGLDPGAPPDAILAASAAQSSTPTAPDGCPSEACTRARPRERWPSCTSTARWASCRGANRGSAGAVPGVVVTLVEEQALSQGRAMALLAASAVGVILADAGHLRRRGRGMPVRIGAAGAIGAAAVVEAAGGSALARRQRGRDRLQNSMGSVYDLVAAWSRFPATRATRSRPPARSCARTSSSAAA